MFERDYGGGDDGGDDRGEGRGKGIGLLGQLVKAWMARGVGYTIHYIYLPRSYTYQTLVN